MAGTIGSILGFTHAKHVWKRSRSMLTGRRHRPARSLGLTAAIIAASATIALALLPLATPASAQGAWTLAIGTPSDATTTGFVVNGTITPNGDAGFVYVVYEPTGTALTSDSPTSTALGGFVSFNAGVTTPQAVSMTVGQLTPNTSYTFELQAFDQTNSTFYTSSTTGTASTTTVPTGAGTPIIPPNKPPADGIFGNFCSTDAECLNNINGVRAAQEQLPPLSLPSNWSTLTPPEQMFVWTNIERLSRGETSIPNLVNTYDADIQTGITNGTDPPFTGVPCCGGSIAFPDETLVTAAMYGWIYNDGVGTNADCSAAGQPGCFGHRDNILGDPSNFSANPTEMDAGSGTESNGNNELDAIFDPNPNPPPAANIVFTWAQEQPFLGGTTPGPAVTSISPTSGPTGGGTTVTITGSGFTGATSVLFGTVAATSFTVNSDTEVTAVSPAQTPAGFHNVYVTTSGGRSAAVTADQFTYVATKPAVTSISPTSGPTGGGTTVTITGTNLNGATKVLFGTVAATSFTVVSSTDITAVSPAQTPAGFHNIYVTTPGGTSAAVAGDEFTYVNAKPAVTGVSPTSGPTGGGTTVTITGTNLSGATQVLFGTVAATSFTVVSSTDITAVSPAQAAATHGIYVTTPGGSSAAVTADQFTYVNAKPAVTGVSPTSGPTGGGTTVTITGTNLSGATKVLFGTVAATSFTVVSSTDITAVSPAQAGAGFHNVLVTTPGGTSAAVTADQFTYVG